MQTIIANIKHAIRNNETTTIGGGEFSPDELSKIVALYAVAEKALEAFKWAWGGEPQGQLEFTAMQELDSILNNKG